MDLRRGAAGVLALVLAACGGASDTLDPSVPIDPYADYGTFLNVLTPGQADCPSGGAEPPGTGACPENFTDQQRMYENLAFIQPGQLKTEADLVPAFYKHEAFIGPDGAPPAETSFVSETPVTDGTHTATIKRDTFGIPYVFGETRADVMFGTGYASAEDRMFLIDVLRHVGRGRQADFLGGNPPDDYDRSLGIKAGYSEEELQQQIDQLDDRYGADGAQAQLDVVDYVAGLNQYVATIRDVDEPIEYSALNLTLNDFTPRDVVAIATLVQAIFAVGGGNEVNQVRQLQELYAQTGDAEKACRLWRDLRHFDDPEKPTTSDDRFETQSPPTVNEDACPLLGGFHTQYPGSVMFDRGSLQLRDPLALAPCYAPDSPSGPACPDFNGDVTDDTVASAAAGPAATLFARVSGAWNHAVQLASALVHPAPQYTEQQLADGRRRAQQTIDSVHLALAEGIDLPKAMSNALLITRDRSANGHPIAVFGPQTGYTAPQLLLELNQQGGDIHSRGMTFGGLPYVVIGRGVDFAWSATSSGNDIIDTRVLRLCDPAGGSPSTDSRGYLYQGQCRPMFVREDQWTAEYNAGAPPPPGSPAVGQSVTRLVLRAPDYGPVFAFATVNGQPVALATQRSTFFGEVDSALPFVRTSRNQMPTAQAFFDTFNKLTGTFNWFYINANDIAYFNSGLMPVRAAGVHPDLPTWGDGSYDWAQGGTGFANPAYSTSNFLPLEAHPHQVNAAKGFITSWNNAQAPGFWAAEHQASYGPLHRSLNLDVRIRAQIASGAPFTPPRLVEIMEDGGATDLRAQEVLPSAFAVLASPGPELTADQKAAVNALKAWVKDGIHGLGGQRRDRDGPGQNTAALQYKDHDSVVLMDYWWNTMIEHALPQIFSLETTPNGNVMIEGRHDAPGPIGSSFIGGYYGYMRRALDMALGTSAHPYRELKCAGTGVLADCRAALVASLQAALDSVQGSERPEEYDAIVHTPVGLAPVPAIHWINRPTWQQVISPTSLRHP